MDTLLMQDNPGRVLLIQSYNIEMEYQIWARLAIQESKYNSIYIQSISTPLGFHTHT